MDENRGRSVPRYANLAGVEVGDDFPVRILGAINVSPESFYKGSVAADESGLRQRAERMAAEGADMIDVGAMSTAPYLETEVSEAEEIRRLVWAVGILRKAAALPISADTKRSRVALAALDAGAAAINDISGFRHDPVMAHVTAQRADGAILMASESAPGAQDPVGTLRDLLQQGLDLADAAGLPRNRIVLDPGIGFFRKAALSWEAWDCEVLRRLGELRSLGRPILVGLSRKSFIGKILGKPDPDDRLIGSLATTAIAVLNGAHVVRTHDVAATRDAIRMAEALRLR
jgi:dihydropteroate synthase